MSEIAADLAAWHELGKTVTIDVSALAAQLRAKMEREIAAEDLLEQRRELALAAVRRLQALCRPLNEALQSVHPRPQLDIIGEQYAQTSCTRSATAARRRSPSTTTASARSAAASNHAGSSSASDGALS